LQVFFDENTECGSAHASVEMTEELVVDVEVQVETHAIIADVSAGLLVIGLKKKKVSSNVPSVSGCPFDDGLVKTRGKDGGETKESRDNGGESHSFFEVRS
jgi:hypothetical protein